MERSNYKLNRKRDNKRVFSERSIPSFNSRHDVRIKSERNGRYIYLTEADISSNKAQSGVNDSYQSYNAKTSKHKNKKKYYLLQAVSICIISVGLVMFAISLKTDRLIDTQIQALEKITTGKSINASSSIDESSPKPSREDIYNYQRANDKPKRIEIQKIGVLAKVLDVGIDREGQIDVPVNLYDVGWYTGSSNPHESHGSAIIVGHIGGLYLPGVFDKLKELKSDDEISVVMGDNSIINYSVKEKNLLDASEMNMSSYLSYDIKKPAKLILITCGGRVDPTTRTYLGRVVVTAERIN